MHDSIVSLLSLGEGGWGLFVAQGLGVTVILACTAAPCAFVLGFLLCLAQRSKSPVIFLTARFYSTILRSLPELLTLFIIYYGLQSALKSFEMPFLSDLQISPFLAGILALSLVAAAFSSEVFRSAFAAIPKGQYEAAWSLGLPSSVILLRVILPQVLRLSLPGLSNLWMVLLKETALVSAIGLPELIRQTSVAARVTKEPFLFFGIALVLYLILGGLSSGILHFIQRAQIKKN